MEAKHILCLILLVEFLFFQVNSDPVEDKQALLDFVNNLPHSRSLNWNESSPVCNNWTGVICSRDGARVIAVRLPGVGFHGPIPPNTLSRLSALQILSLRSNGISGEFPFDISNLKNLSFLYLQYNNLSGSLPVDFSLWPNLTIVNLSNNRFNGSIPYSFSNLSHLAALNLANNSLSGEVPDFNLPNLHQINLSNNNLSGSVPRSLRRFPNSVFSGNNIPFETFPPHASPVVTPSDTPYPRSRNKRGLGEKTLLGIIVASCVLGLLAFVFFIAVCCSRKKGEAQFPGKLLKGGMSPEKVVSRSQDANNRLTFFEGCNYAFDLEDLLRASAEVLGKGTFGMAYKAILEDATTVVVKRLKEVSVGKRDFEQQMEVVGSIRQENVVELKAYYYSKDEKLMVYDYYSQGSISSMLHGKRGGERVPLDWDTRMRIAIGAARGIACIHAENGGKFVHGNIKSSNIFLNSQQYGCVSDLGLATITSPLAPPIARAAGYRAPEVADTRKAAQPSDVYSFGVVLLELLTGKSPIHTTGGDEIIHLVRWVHSVVREEWTAEVFDVELMRYPNIEEEMVEMLQIAMSCVARMPDKRPKMTDVVRMIENVRQMDTENHQSPQNRSESSTPPALVIERES
ncbi:inactive receptor kinase [Populus alba x Populus x berolinensis]|uniref:Leucine-rich repeat transmembrane protein kinase n=2 Tax=Populus alba TaxID=43335 RepID=A0A4U5PL22_POPAL|nr:probable inactive receptor kinase At4g23740 isoform X2 [Populus alba]XP_034894837.1 probable inactive receptor kinase At4g23740 isoform X2 [Populus alba]XP_034894838.1 probable inactive receptor kinase At4g23740 isoform X2 [Populus alba]KAJ6962292.1 inactive receptor kinase [Populus alba x Populus x berolinensis]TKR97569.1 leucine-rich repeat transmembrane protein kinase [Populus alba]